MITAYEVFAKTKSKNVADRATYDAVVNLLKRSSLSSVLNVRHNQSIDLLLSVLDEIKNINHGGLDDKKAAVKVPIDAALDRLNP